MNRKDLVGLLELVKPALSPTNLVPIYQCFMFNQKTVAAYNDQLGIVVNCSLGDFPFAVDGNTLLGLLQHSQSEEVDLSVNKENVLIDVGRSNFKLPYFNESEFLFEEPKPSWDATLELNEELTDGLEICRTTTSSDHAAPAIMGVCFNFDVEKTATLYSCDGDSISQVSLLSKPKGKGAYTVPNEFCDALLKICEETTTYKGIMGFNEGWVMAKIDSGYTLYGRLIENSNPLDHQELINKTLGEAELSFVGLPMGFTAALARARVLSDRESAKTNLTVKSGKLKLDTSTHMGHVKDELSIRGHGDVIADVHASLVQRSIGTCDEIAILENCTAYRLGDSVLQIIANIGA